MEKLTLTPNVPQQIALKFPDGKLVEGRFGDQMMYSLVNNQVMYLDTDVAAKINALELRKNEPFWICKRWTGKKGDQIQWDIYRLDGNSAAVATGSAPTAIESQIAAQRQQPIPPMPAAAMVGRVVFANGNGNKPVNGNGAPPNGARAYEAPGIPAPPIKVGYDVALRRILRVAIAELKTGGEQWSDNARQDLVSTLFIQATRDGAVTWLPLTREEGN
jgi:hypothetical protein